MTCLVRNNLLTECNIDQKEFQKKLRQKGVMIYPLSWYYIEGKPSTEEYILGFTRMKKEDMIRGIEIIREVLYSK